MFRKILVQVDPSRPLLKAPELARRLARAYDAELVALYVVDEQISHMLGGDIIRTMDSALSAVGEEALDDYEEALHHYEEEVGKEVRFSKTIGYGDTAETIAKYVMKHNVDLVVTGGFHSSVYTRMPFGSVVNEIIRKTPAHVLLHRDTFQDPLRAGPVVVPYDGSPHSRRAVVASAAFADRFDQTLDIAHVHNRGARSRAERLLSEIDELAPKLKVPVTTTPLRRPVVHTRPWKILKHAKGRDASLISLSMMGARTRFGGLSPIVERLVVHTDRPLLVIHS